MTAKAIILSCDIIVIVSIILLTSTKEVKGSPKRAPPDPTPYLVPNPSSGRSFGSRSQYSDRGGINRYSEDVGKCGG